MAEDNRISAQMTAEVKTQIITKYQEIKGLMAFLINLTPKERREIPTLGTERSAMDQTFAAQMAAHPDLVPTYVDMPELGLDRKLRADLLDIHIAAQDVDQAVLDTAHLAGADIYMTYMGFYNNVKAAAHRNRPGANAALEALQPFIPRGRRTPPPTTPPPANP